MHNSSSSFFAGSLPMQMLDIVLELLHFAKLRGQTRQEPRYQQRGHCSLSPISVCLPHSSKACKFGSRVPQSSRPQSICLSQAECCLSTEPQTLHPKPKSPEPVGLLGKYDRPVTFHSGPEGIRISLTEPLTSALGAVVGST